jgi:hypothetical protein
MKTRKVNVFDLDDGDQIIVNVGDVAVRVAMGYNVGSETATIEITRPTTDGRRLRTTVKDVKGNGQTTTYHDEAAASVCIEPCCPVSLHPEKVSQSN